MTTTAKRSPSEIVAEARSMSAAHTDDDIGLQCQDVLDELLALYEATQQERDALKSLRQTCVDAAQAGLDRAEAAESELSEREKLMREFIAYWTTDRAHGNSEVGCGMCGGILHSATCFVGRMAKMC